MGVVSFWLMADSTSGGPEARPTGAVRDRVDGGQAAEA